MDDPSNRLAEWAKTSLTSDQIRRLARRFKGAGDELNESASKAELAVAFAEELVVRGLDLETLIVLRDERPNRAQVLGELWCQARAEDALPPAPLRELVRFLRRDTLLHSAEQVGVNVNGGSDVHEAVLSSVKRREILSHAASQIESLYERFAERLRDAVTARGKLTLIQGESQSTVENLDDEDYRIDPEPLAVMTAVTVGPLGEDLRFDFDEQTTPIHLVNRWRAHIGGRWPRNSKGRTRQVTCFLYFSKTMRPLRPNVPLVHQQVGGDSIVYVVLMQEETHGRSLDFLREAGQESDAK